MILGNYFLTVWKINKNHSKFLHEQTHLSSDNLINNPNQQFDLQKGVSASKPSIYSRLGLTIAVGDGNEADAINFVPSDLNISRTMSGPETGTGKNKFL